MKFHHCLFKKLQNQNVADGRTNGRKDNVKTVYIPPHVCLGVCVGGGGNKKCMIKLERQKVQVDLVIGDCLHSC